ncbi:hypothetical protein VNO80_24130 [Phaseolus coccineus]|uniref:Uncharacterized protein n=1 Tax=Phaseolus coccineus TaxID=3886 RepID=A0AAN9LSA6_PHACN
MLLKTADLFHEEEEVTIGYRAFIAPREISWKCFSGAFSQVTSTSVYPIKLKCGEFLLLLTGHMNGRDSAPLATIHEDTRRLLGENSASLIWAASQFDSTLNPEKRLTFLQNQARRVLESLDLY